MGTNKLLSLVGCPADWGKRQAFDGAFLIVSMDPSSVQCAHCCPPVRMMPEMSTVFSILCRRAGHKRLASHPETTRPRTSASMSSPVLTSGWKSIRSTSPCCAAGWSSRPVPGSSSTSAPSPPHPALSSQSVRCLWTRYLEDAWSAWERASAKSLSTQRMAGCCLMAVLSGLTTATSRAGPGSTWGATTRSLTASSWSPRAPAYRGVRC
mmetsp:Transcript_124191/g.362455  ORF Transcript_124191/g.362455 Transcript_124191/m.362455 type:complete len:209 (+) Transcript_124191:1817-2443(+)